MSEKQTNDEDLWIEYLKVLEEIQSKVHFHYEVIGCVELFLIQDTPANFDLSYFREEFCGSYWKINGITIFNPLIYLNIKTADEEQFSKFRQAYFDGFKYFADNFRAIDPSENHIRTLHDHFIDRWRYYYGFASTLVHYENITDSGYYCGILAAYADYETNNILRFRQLSDHIFAAADVEGVNQRKKRLVKSIKEYFGKDVSMEGRERIIRELKKRIKAGDYKNAGKDISELASKRTLVDPFRLKPFLRLITEDMNENEFNSCYVQISENYRDEQKLSKTQKNK